MLCSHRICGVDIYTVCKGIPSGSFLTALFNSGANQIMTRHAYLASAIFKKSGIPYKEYSDRTILKILWSFMESDDMKGLMKQYEQDVESRFYGDDASSCVGDHADFYNMKTNQYFFKKLFGLNTTHPGKNIKISDMEEPYMTREEMTYLKRHFRLVDEKWNGQLEIDVIKEILYWTHGTPNQDLVESAFDSFCNELTRYNERFYNAMVDMATQGSTVFKLIKTPYHSRKAKLEKEHYARESDETQTRIRDVGEDINLLAKSERQLKYRLEGNYDDGVMLPPHKIKGIANNLQTEFYPEMAFYESDGPSNSKTGK